MAAKKVNKRNLAQALRNNLLRRKSASCSPIGIKKQSDIVLKHAEENVRNDKKTN